MVPERALADAGRLQVLRDLGRLSTEGRERRQLLMGTKKVMFLPDMKQKILNLRNG